MSSDLAIQVAGLSKCYQIYAKPQDRLKQSLYPRFQRFLKAPQKAYCKEFWAFRDISIDVKKGETIGIIGRNGSGKSTLLQAICGTLNPTAGTVQTNGRVAALLELGSGFNPEFTGRENVHMNAAVLGLKPAEIESRFDSIAKFADIGDFIEEPVKTYSSGMMVRLAFAVIAHVDADILVIDEALAVGDAFFTQKCMRFLRNFMKTGTVLFVSHDNGAIVNLCSRALWLDKGRVIRDGSPKDVCEAYLEAFYEAQQGKAAPPLAPAIPTPAAAKPAGDQRQKFLNNSNLRNDIQVFDFDDEAPFFGHGEGQITAVIFMDAQYQRLGWIVGGEEVVLRVQCIAHAELTSPIIGFFIKDRLGQCLFGDNTWLSYIDQPVACPAGESITADFAFQMPRLAAGDYAITVALADGTQDQHVQHHWIHDAVTFKSLSSSVSSGLLGIPIKSIRLHRGP